MSKKQLNLFSTAQRGQTLSCVLVLPQHSLCLLGGYELNQGHDCLLDGNGRLWQGEGYTRTSTNMSKKYL